MTELGRVIVDNPSQPLKQNLPMLLIELEMSMEVRPLVEKKQYSPKLVTELGMVMEVKPLHPEKVLLVDYQYYTL